MVFCAHRRLILLVCIGLLVVYPEKVFGLGSIDHVYRWDKQEQGLVQKNSRALKAVVEELDTKKKSTPVAPAAPPSPTLDPNSMSKRKVRRGSDPIHNKC